MSQCLHMADVAEFGEHDEQVAQVLEENPELLRQQAEGGDSLAHMAVRHGATRVLATIASIAPSLLSAPNWFGKIPEQIQGAGADMAHRLRISQQAEDTVDLADRLSSN